MGTQTRAFRYECEMLPLVFPELAVTLGLERGAVAYLPAPMLGNVIPDLLVGCWSAKPSQSLAKLTHVDAAVFALLESATELTEKDILSRIYLPPIVAAKTFSKLERTGALVRTESGSLRVVENAGTQDVEIVAVELKMKRWRDALGQAIDYQRFADRAYVVLDGNQVNLSDEIVGEFLTGGVGLLLQYGSTLKRVVDAQSDLRFTSDRVLAAQKLTEVLRHHS